VTREQLLRYVLVCFVLALQSGAAAGATAAAAREKLRALQSRIEALTQRLDEAQDKRSDAVDALKESEKAISDAGEKLRKLARDSRAAKARQEALRTEAAQADAALARERAVLGRLMYQHYLHGRSEPLKLLLNREDPNQIARQLEYFGYVSRARAGLIGELRAGLARLEGLKREAADEAARLERIAAQQTEQKHRLEKERKARKAVLARVADDIRRQQHEIGTLKRNEARLTRLIEQLSRIVSRPGAKFRLRNERLPDGSTAGKPFAELKGRLALPVKGELGNRFGSPRSSGLTWKGLFIAAPRGEEVKAIAAGRVVFSDWLRGFGNLLIIDHGEAYMSLYGNNETLYRHVGDEVRGGETIAAVGNSGGNENSGLYFELRHEGKPFDPLTWVAVR
jgi:septal ring factor EnvC (AmiA/AmiB activator)